VGLRQPGTAALGCRQAGVADEPIVWLSPQSDRDRLLLDTWCEAVGPPAVELAARGASQTDRLAVVTWNAANGAGDLRGFVARLRHGEFTDGNPVAAFVLLLQEVERPGPDVPEGPASHEHTPGPASSEPDIRALAAALELSVFYVPAMRSSRPATDRGNAILSTTAISDLVVLELPFERQRRIAQFATVNGTHSSGAPWKLRVVNTHLETRAGLTRGGPAAARQRQARALLQALGTSSLPTVIGGDLNTSWGDDEPAVKELRRAYPDAHQMPGTTWQRGLMSARLDHMFARLPAQRLRVSRVKKRFGSDHHPLVTTIDTGSLLTPTSAGGGDGGLLRHQRHHRVPVERHVPSQ
jgi:endonuclease/exonuclease/phosphatase family metal-dependent hydrolase